jgi:hypothetical protein
MTTQEPNAGLHPMQVPARRYSPQEIIALSDREWMRLVGEWAYPKRKHTMQEAMALAILNGTKGIVETGCIRNWAGDGQSTLILATLAIRIGATFHSIDNRPECIKAAQEWLGELAETVIWHTADSEQELKGWSTQIDLLYLDSMDCKHEDPVPSQVHQRREITHAYPHLTRKSVVLMDDADFEHGGKTKLAKEFLLERDWRVEADTKLLMMRHSSI